MKQLKLFFIILALFAILEGLASCNMPPVKFKGRDIYTQTSVIVKIPYEDRHLYSSGDTVWVDKNMDIINVSYAYSNAECIMAGLTAVKLK